MRLKQIAIVAMLAAVFFNFGELNRLEAAELRVLDSGGLVRAVKVVKGDARVVVAFHSRNGALAGECVATNIDGLAVEQRVSVSARGECVFLTLSVGSWQIEVPSKWQWRAMIYE